MQFNQNQSVTYPIKFLTFKDSLESLQNKIDSLRLIFDVLARDSPWNESATQGINLFLDDIQQHTQAVCKYFD